MDYKLPKRIENSNKATYGRVLNIAGSDYMSGAACLSSLSALKIGSTDRVIDAVASQTQNVVFLPRKDMTQYIENADVIEIGCGLSTDFDAVEIFKTFLGCVKPSHKVLVDADGLNILAKNYDLYKNSQIKNLILTPHPKEAARLLGKTTEEILSDIKKSAREISEKFGCITVLKTHKTYVYSPDGREYTNTTGNNSMAKAGSGDVLAGMISGLLAQGMDMFEAACLGVYLHGLCGDLAKEKLTEYSVMAEDLISFIPDAIKFYLKN